jgi:small-conductance mechanosensitive channel
VAYGSDVEKVRRTLIEAAEEDPHVLNEPPPDVFFAAFGDSSLNFELVVWSNEMSHRPGRFRSDLNFAIERKLREAGIQIPFPQRDLHIRSSVLQEKAEPGKPGKTGLA